MNFKFLICIIFGVLLLSSCTTNQTMSPELTTTVASQITINSAISGGALITDGGVRILEQGICWDSITNPTITKNKKIDASGKSVFSDTISGLKPNKTYYVRAYATNFSGTSYGTDQTFTTLKPGPPINAPTLLTNIVTSIGLTTATSGGSITSDGGAPVTARGVCWSTSASPTVSLSTITSDGTGLGSFTSSITGLLASTTYHVRAYATNSQGTGYGQEQIFVTTMSTAPTLTTSAAAFIGTTTAQSGGNITSDGGSAVTTRGSCWSTSAAPTIALTTKTLDGTGTGSYISGLTGLSASTLYHVRAYATNAIGTSYGNEITFTTSAPVTTPAVPVLFTSVITSIGSTTAVSGGVTTSDGGSTITARGVCWSTTTGPTISLSTKTADGTGPGTYTSSLTGLAPTTTYYVRAYATNTTGTGYGTELSFTTTAQATIATLTTTAISAITTSSATSGGTISSDGGSAVTARGICWSTSSGATVALSTKTTDGTGTGSFTSSITGLAASTLYYVRAYATNAVGTAYGNEVTFTTIAGSANSTGTLSVSVLTVAPGGGYSPKNVVAIWIETNAGVFVKSLLVYANAQKRDLTTWYPNSTGNVVNAVTAATQSSNGTRTCTWNGTNVSGAVVVDGTYLVCMNIADGKVAFASFPFAKGTAAVTLTPANVTGFSNISISWIH